MAIEGYGHCSVAMYSKCSTKIAREYLLHMTLPEEGETKCQVDKPYFISPGNKAMMEVSIKHKDVLSEDRNLGCPNGTVREHSRFSAWAEAVMRTLEPIYAISMYPLLPK